VILKLFYALKSKSALLDQWTRPPVDGAFDWRLLICRRYGLDDKRISAALRENVDDAVALAREEYERAFGATIGTRDARTAKWAEIEAEIRDAGQGDFSTRWPGNALCVESVHPVSVTPGDHELTIDAWHFEAEGKVQLLGPANVEATITEHSDEGDGRSRVVVSATLSQTGVYRLRLIDSQGRFSELPGALDVHS